MNYKIIYDENSELAEFEAENKGYRRDVTVIINNKKYRLYITDIIRLHQDFDSEVESDGIYHAEPNTIIVKEVSKVEIEKTVAQLVADGFFNNLGYK